MNNPKTGLPVNPLETPEGPQGIGSRVVLIPLTWAQVFTLRCAAVEWLHQNPDSPNHAEVRKAVTEVLELLRPSIQSLENPQAPDPGAQGAQ